MHLNLLNTIKLPKNLAHLTKDHLLPKSNYISTRVDSATIQSTSTNKKLVPAPGGHPNRLQSEPAIPNSRQLPSIYSVGKDPQNRVGG